MVNDHVLKVCVHPFERASVPDVKTMKATSSEAGRGPV
jgi:hypothetical protein